MGRARDGMVGDVVDWIVIVRCIGVVVVVFLFYFI